MRIYVTGGTGLVGSNVIKIAREHYNDEIIASLYGPPPSATVDYELDPLDIGDQDAIAAAVRKYKPDAVILSAALLDQVMMYEKRALSWRIMVESTRTFAHACREVNARLVFVSSDWVFDGHEPLVDEDPPPFPVNFYGTMKFASERELASMDDLNYAVGRLAGVYGINYALPELLRKDQGLGFDLGNYVIDQLTSNRLAYIWTGPNVNEIANPTLASDGAEMLLRLAHHDATGIFHCFGSETVSRIEFAHEVARTFAVDPALITPVPTDAEVLAAHANIRIPFRTRASVDKTAMLVGRRSYTVAEALADYRQQWESFVA